MEIDSGEDDIERLIKSINIETPDIKELEKHISFIEWLKGCDEEKILNALNGYVFPALEIVLPAVGVSEVFINNFYKAKFLVELFEKWKENNA